MKSIEIIGFKRANLGKAASKLLRLDANVPCVLYGGAEEVHFHTPEILFRELVYTPEANTVKLTIGKKTFNAILQDMQFHPVSEQIVHADFLELIPGKAVKIEVPVKLVGTAPGVIKGGRLVTKLKKVKVLATPENLPDFLEADISNLEVGKSIKIGDIKALNVTLLQSKSLPLASVETTRQMKQEETAAATPAKKK